MSVNAGRKPKKRKHASKAIQGADRIEITPLDYLLDAMNDDSVPSKVRDRIAKKIAPYFHAKLRRVSSEDLAALNLENFTEDQAEADDEADMDAERRAYIRRVAFSNLD